jgi:hypothetical protein
MSAAPQAIRMPCVQFICDDLFTIEGEGALTATGAFDPLTGGAEYIVTGGTQAYAGARGYMTAKYTPYKDDPIDGRVNVYQWTVCLLY